MPSGALRRALAEGSLTFLFGPWTWLPLVLILLLALFVPFMEVLPTSGSIASVVIALLTRDGALMALSLVLLLAVPVAVCQFGCSA